MEGNEKGEAQTADLAHEQKSWENIPKSGSLSRGHLGLSEPREVYRKYFLDILFMEGLEGYVFFLFYGHICALYHSLATLWAWE